MSKTTLVRMRKSTKNKIKLQAIKNGMTMTDYFDQLAGQIDREKKRRGGDPLWESLI